MIGPLPGNEILFFLVFLVRLMSGQVEVVTHYPDDHILYALEWGCEPGQPMEDQERCYIVVWDDGKVDTGP